jgi:hypothetical protein
MEITTDERVSGSYTSSISMAFNFSSQEIDAAFADPNNAARFSKIFGPGWEDLPDSEKLQQYMELQIWIEGQATELGLKGGTVVPKE